MAALFTADPDESTRDGGKGGTLLLFDGECALCNGWVKFMLRRDRTGALRFAPLQGPTAARILGLHAGQPAPLTTVVWVENVETPQERIHVRSEGALLAIRELGGIWRIVSWLRVVPRVVRDAAYDFIARNRYRWFGKQESCLVPNKAVAARFLP